MQLLERLLERLISGSSDSSSLCLLASLGRHSLRKREEVETRLV
jgi:hypothetical protein